MNKKTNITDWFTRRGITEKTLKDFKVSVNDVSIVIPVYDLDGSFLFNKYRRLPHLHNGPKYSYDFGSKASLYGQQFLSQSDSFVITEGEMDALVLNSHKIPALSSTGGAMTFKHEWVSILENKDITVCFDNDEAGGKGMAKMYELFPNAQFIFVPEDTHVKDISDYFARGGDIHDLMKTAVRFPTIEHVRQHAIERSANWQQIFFHKEVLKNNEPRPTKQRTNNHNSEIERAKEIPIDQFIKVNKAHKAECLWHTEKTPSLHVYRKTNTFYCFGCGKHGDVITLVQKTHNLSFPEAIKFLNKQ